MFVKFFYKLVFFLSFFVVTNKLCSQEDTCFLGNLKEYRIVNKSFAHSLDSIIITVSSLDEFVVLDRKIFVTIFIEDIDKLKITVTPYSCTQFNVSTLERNDQFNGYLYCHDHLVLIAMPQFEFSKSFIEKTDKSNDIFISNSDNLSDHILPAPFSYYCEVVDGSFLVEEMNYSTGDGCYYLYKIKPEDTWEKLAKKFRCSELELKLNREETEQLLQGSYINLEFSFADGRVQHVWRRR